MESKKLIAKDPEFGIPSDPWGGDIKLSSDVAYSMGRPPKALLAAISHFDDKDFHEAIKDYEEHLKSNPNSLFTLKDKGIALAKIGKYEDAIKCFEEALKIDPNYNAAWYNKGVTFHLLSKYEDAIKCYDIIFNSRNLRSKYNKNWYIEALYGKGVALHYLGKYEDAIKYYDKVLNVNYNAAWYNKGIALYYLEKYEDAIECYNKTLERNLYYRIYDATIWYNIALAKIKKDYEIEDILRDLKEAIKSDRDKYLQLVRQEKEFESIKNDKRFIQLIASTNTT